MADTDDARRAEIIAELQRRGVEIPQQAAAPAAPVATGTSQEPQPAADPPASSSAVEGVDPQTSSQGPAQATLDTLHAIGSDILKGLPEMPGAAARGAAGAVKESATAVQGASNWLGQHGVQDPLVTAAGLGAKGWNWLASQTQDIFDKPTTVTGNLTEGVAQFATGMVGLGKVLKIPGLIGTAGKIGESILQNGAVAGIVFGGHEQRLSDLLEQSPAIAPYVPDFLSSKPGDTEAEGRLKNALEGMIVGPLADAFMWSLKGVRAISHGDMKGAVEASEQAEKFQAKAHAEGEAKAPSDPVEGQPAKAGEEPKPAEGEPQAAPQASSEGIPKDETIVGPKGDHEAPAPFAEDLRTGAEATPPLPAFKLSDVLPKVPRGMQKDAVEAIQRRFTMNPDDGGLHPISPDQRFNLDNINSPETLKAALDAVTVVGEKAIQSARVREVYDWNYVTKKSAEFADIVGANPSQLLTVLGHDATTLQHLVARMNTYRAFMVDAVDNAATMADKALTMEGSAEGARLQAQALRSANLAVQVSAMAKGIESGVARTLGAQRLAAKSAKRIADWDLEKLAQQMESGVYHSDDKGLLLLLKGFKDNPKGFNQLMDKSMGGKLKDAITTWGMNSLLSSPKTWVANLVSNIAMSGYGPIERAVAGMMPASEVGASRAFARMKDEYVGMTMGLMDSMRVAGTALKNNVSVLDPKNGGHVGPNGEALDGLSSRSLGLTRDIFSPTGELIRTDTTPALSMMMDGISKTVNIPSRMLTGGDELTKQVVYRGFLYSRAAEAARIRGLKGDEFSKFVADRMDQGFADGGNLKAVGAATDKEGLQVARETTFSQDLEYGISRWVQGMSNDSLIARLVVPFVRTPTNIFRFTWKHTPIINALEEGVRRDWRSGGEARAKVQAQMVTGAAMWTLAGSIAYSGNVTGSSPLNPELRKAKEATGWKEYAIKSGDKYLQYNRFDPFASILGLAADFVDLSAHVSQNDLDKVAWGMTLALTKNLTSKTYMQGLMNVFNAIGDAQSGRSTIGLDTFAYRTAGSWIVPSIVASGKGELDDSLREVRSFVDAVKARLPGYSKDLPPVRNMLGEAVEAPKAYGPDFISPIGLTVNKHDPVYDELARQMMTADHPLGRAMPQLPGTKIDLREVKLASNGQNAFDRMQELLHGSGVKDALGKLFASPAYQKAQDGSLDYSSAPGTKLALTNLILQRYKEVARQKLLAENPDLHTLYIDEIKRQRLTGAVGDTGRHYQPPGFLDSLFGSRK